MTIREILQRFENPKKSGNGWQVKCPSHADRVASLSISNGGGKILLHCHAGCTAMAIVSALGLRMGDLFAEPREPQQSNDLPKQFDGSLITTSYEYRDAEGNLRYRVLRTANKDFPQQRLEQGKWIWKGPEVKYLYRLPEILADDSDQPVFIPEGEKDVDALRKLGLLATCNSGGAEKFTQDNEALRGRTVVILPDNDAAGTRHAAQVKAKLEGIAAKVITLEFEDLPDKGDVSDWIRAGGTRDQLLIAVDGALKESQSAKKRNEPRAEERFFAASETLIRPKELSIMGLAARFHEKYYKSCRYIERRDMFYNYVAGIWLASRCEAETKTQIIINEVHDEAKEVEERVKKLQQQYNNGDLAVLNQIGPALEYHEALVKFLAKIKVPTTMNQILQFARSQVLIKADDFDPDDTLLNVANGTIELSSGRFREHRAIDLCSMISSVGFDATAVCPRWEKFLSEIFLDDPDLVDFMQRLIGYCISGDTSEQVFLILHGDGSNGKSELLWVLGSLLGGYMRSANIDTFMEEKPTGGHNEDIARLRGARLVATSETEKTKRLAEALVKKLTGQETITASFKHERTFEYTPKFTILLAANHKPVIVGTDYGIWRRIVLIPFQAKFVKPGVELGKDTFPIDPNLRADLMAELPGILNWAVKGYRIWRDRGLDLPEIVKVASADYQKESDRLGAFIDEEMMKSDDRHVYLNDLYQAFRTWAENGGMKAVSVRVFSADLRARGIEVRPYGKDKRTAVVGYVLIQRD